MPVNGRRRNYMWAGILAVLLTLLPTYTRAIEIPPAGINAYIQTSGPNAPLYVGDYYNSVEGANTNELNTAGHVFQVFVPCRWASNQAITFSLFDPEVNPNPPASPLPNAPVTLDEIRDTKNGEADAFGNDILDTSLASNTTFTITTPQGHTITKTYTPNGGTNGLWVEFVTFTPSQPQFGCGTYQLSTRTGDDLPYVVNANGTTSGTQDNDDNGWVLRVAHDPDCTVSPGTCSAVSRANALLMSNGNEQDDLDGVPGTGDELVIGLVHTSFQHAATSCQDFFTFVDGREPDIAFYNFDMDLVPVNQNAMRVTYFPPDGSSYTPTTGTLSVNETWNNAPTSRTPPTAGGDHFAISNRDTGWWRTQVCINARNQYIFQGPENKPIYFTQPPTPAMQVGKSDGETLVTSGQVLSYTIGFTNTSDTTPTPGIANNVVLTDTLPADTTYMSCAINAPFTGTCSESNGLVLLRLVEGVKAGASGSVRVSVRVNDNALPRNDAAVPPPTKLLTNTVRLDYTDELDNPYGSIFARDIDEIAPPTPPTAIMLASLTATRVNNTAVVRWTTTAEQNTWGFYVLRGSTRQQAQAQRVNSAIVLARGRGQTGGSYEWRDPALVSAEMSFYWLQEVEIDGTTHLYGPVQLGAEPRVFLPLLGR